MDNFESVEGDDSGNKRAEVQPFVVIGEWDGTVFYVRGWSTVRVYAFALLLKCSLGCAIQRFGYSFHRALLLAGSAYPLYEKGLAMVGPHFSNYALDRYFPSILHGCKGAALIKAMVGSQKSPGALLRRGL